MKFELLVPIGEAVPMFIRALEDRLGISVDQSCISKILADAENNQVLEKNYSLGAFKRGWRRRSMRIHARVEAYEPETIWIVVKGIGHAEVKALTQLKHLGLTGGFRGQSG